MKSRKKQYIIIAFIAALANCQNIAKNSSDSSSVKRNDSSAVINNKNNDDSFKTTSDTTNIDKEYKNLSCDELIVLLIKNSSFDPEMKKLKFSARVDQINNGVIKIELTIKNTERGDDVPLSWIDLDQNKKELKDVTVDPNNPIKLRFDSILFHKVIEHCNKVE